MKRKLRQQPPETPSTSDWTIDLFIDAATLLLVRRESRTTLIYPSREDSTEEQIAPSLYVSVYSRFDEDFDIVPPDPAPTPTPDPHADATITAGCSPVPDLVS